MTRSIKLIVVHCAATPSGQWLGNKAPGTAGYRTAPAIIDDWHRQRGFARQSAARARFNPELSSIGYHYLIDIDGKVWTGRGHDEVGAHVAGHNADSLGICMVGGAERDGRFTYPQWTALEALVSKLSHQLQLHLTDKTICGHRDLSPDHNGDGKITSVDWLKTCPGFDVSNWRSRGMRPESKNVFLAAGGSAA